MLTLFSTPKPFLGHIGVIQRNALESWKRLDANAEVILFGDDEGTAEVCAELGLRHEPKVERSRFGTKRLAWIFGRAQEMARHEVLCYANCDIVLTAEFVNALRRVRAWQPSSLLMKPLCQGTASAVPKAVEESGVLTPEVARNDGRAICDIGSRFLMVGRRWDTEITEPIDFSASDWQEKLLARAKAEGIQRFYHNIDYFAFPRGLYGDIPELVIGRVGWDHWLVREAAARGAAVVDASEAVCAVHQNHDYGYHPQGMQGIWNDEEARKNLELAGGEGNTRTIEDATFRLTREGIVPNRFAWLAPAKRKWRKVSKALRGALREKAWYPLLDVTRKVRHAVGLKQDSVPPVLRSRERRHWMD